MRLFDGSGHGLQNRGCRFNSDQAFQLLSPMDALRLLSVSGLVRYQLGARQVPFDQWPSRQALNLETCVQFAYGTPCAASEMELSRRSTKPLFQVRPLGGAPICPRSSGTARRPPKPDGSCSTHDGDAAGMEQEWLASLISWTSHVASTWPATPVTRGGTSAS